MSDLVLGVHFEYAIEVPERGYLGFAGNLTNGTDFTNIVNEPDAKQMLKNTQERYRSMGCPEIANTCRIVERTITATATRWQTSQLNNPEETTTEGMKQ